MPDSVFYARPRHPRNPATYEPLIDHLIAVENHCVCNTPNETTLSSGTRTLPVLRVMAWLHDLGKLTTWWQRDHKNKTVPDINRPPGNVGNHAFIGGVATWWVLDQLGYDDRVKVTAAIAVARHHNSLPNLESYFSDSFTDESRWETVGEQINNIHTHAPSHAQKIFDHIEATAVYEQSSQKPVSWSRFISEFDTSQTRNSIKEAVLNRTRTGIKNRIQTTAVYTDILELWGGLKGADTPASAGLKPSSDRCLPSADIITKYVETQLSPPTNPENPIEELNHTRESIRKDAMSNLSGVLEDNSMGDTISNIYSITLPTGAGKTLTGTQAALKLHHINNNTGPLLYILPYTSIIDQTKNEYNKLFDRNSIFNKQTNILDQDISVTVDHYLANASSEDKKDEDENQDPRSELAYESWHSDITLSTTVQLWESLCGPTKSQGTKIPQFYESTIIIDEPQTIPTAWWSRAESLLEIMQTVFNANVILMTATHPPLDYPTPNTDSAVELASDNELPDNVQIRVDESFKSGSPLEPDSASKRILDDIEDGKDSILSIHNTVSNTRSITNEVTEKLSEVSGVEYVTIHDIYQKAITDDGENQTVYATLPPVNDIVENIINHSADVLIVPLTTRYRPCDRSRILAILASLLSRISGENETDSNTQSNIEIPQVVGITTQLIEAGVDISFEALYRDLAPYDSLIQAAGRCNRNYEYGIGGGDVTLWYLASSDSGNPNAPASIYNSSGVNRLFHTRKTIGDLTESDPPSISERNLLDKYEEYKKAIAKRRSTDTPDISNVKGDKLTNESIIPDDYPELSIFISLTPAGDELVGQYQHAIEKDKTRRKIELRGKLRHIECSLPKSSEGAKLVKSMGTQIDDDLYFVDSDTVDVENIYTLHGLA